jgi:hypothetical protein
MMGIKPWECSCLIMEEIDPVIYQKSTKIEDLEALKLILNTLADEAIRQMNSEVYTSSKLYQACQHLSLRDIKIAYGLRINNVQEFIRLEIRVNENYDAIFQVNYLISSYSNELVASSNWKYPVQTVIYRDVMSKFRILNISRLDKYSGPCEVFARENSLKAEYCVCY